MRSAFRCSASATVSILSLMLFCINIQFLSDSIVHNAVKINPEDLHPSLWRASQMARNFAHCVSTGHSSLDNQLPGNGWLTGEMTDLHLQQPGIGEMRLLAPALAAAVTRQVALLQPPQQPQALALAAMGDPARVGAMAARRSHR